MGGGGGGGGGGRGEPSSCYKLRWVYIGRGCIPSHVKYKIIGSMGINKGARICIFFSCVQGQPLFTTPYSVHVAM